MTPGNLIKVKIADCSIYVFQAKKKSLMEMK